MGTEALLQHWAANSRMIGGKTHDPRNSCMHPPNLATLVSTDWLALHRGDPQLRIFDCTVSLVPVPTGGVRPESGRAAWEQGHIPGSGFADLLTDLSDRQTKLPIMMPSAEQFAEAMGRYGVGPGSGVVLYDSGNHTWSTRVWWMLRAMGFDQAAVLDGGLVKWKREGRPLSTELPAWPAARFEARPQPGVFVGRDDVKACLGQRGVHLVNALSPDEFTGKVSRTPRPGRIPGSRNLPAASLVDPATNAFLPLDVLRAKFEAQGLLDGSRVVNYCGGGIAATSTAFTLVRLGAQDVAVYDGSLVDWSSDPDLPMETG
jgi:thiosulfate/3-mercaptopyruvate sulfurtransferase